VISILIPTYNYNITALLKALKVELDVSKLIYEILCYEDGSSKYVEENSAIASSIKHAEHIISKENKGRITTRQSLANMARYDWLLFLDADVIPKNSSFLQAYSKYLNSNYDTIYGGYFYNLSPPEKQFSLRWHYGKNHEQVEAKKRNKNPYKIIISGNFLIKKQIFLEINSQIENDGYGYDNYLGALMKLNNINVFHINNNVIHNGLDTNTVFLNKVERAVDTVVQLNENYRDLTTENTLLEVYKKTKSMGLSIPIAWVFNLSKSAIKRQLLGAKPNLKLLQFYKLGYLCTTMSNNI
tara:strand:+ start:29552 stop:30445 length:894 start_codon:yes stop_codon:yes gene_type:complete